MHLQIKTRIIALVFFTLFIAQTSQQACFGPLKPCGYRNTVLGCCPGLICLTDICVPASITEQ